MSPFSLRGPRAHPQTLWRSKTKKLVYSPFQYTHHFSFLTLLVLSTLLIFCIYMYPFSLRGPRATLKRSEAQRIFFLCVFHFSIRTLLAFLYFLCMCPLFTYAGHAPTLRRSDAQMIFFWYFLFFSIRTILLMKPY